MSDDLIERLRDFTEEDAYAMPWTFGAVVRDAADELARLRAEVERLKADGQRIMNEAVKMLNEDASDYNCKTNAMIERHAQQMEELRAALADERAHADALAEALTKAGEALSSVCPGEVGEALQQHRARRQG